jgi:asparagine synthase (glutamine-hydrolysing)
MPNVIGIWDPGRSEESIRAVLARQLHRVRVPNIPYKEYTAVSPGFGMALLDHGILENGEQPVRSEEGHHFLLLDGEIYNAEELDVRFRKALPQRPLSDPELCLELILREGPGVANLFNGLFCCVLYDCRARKLTLISDRYGFRPMFYVQRRKAVLFGSELKALCAADPDFRKIDEIGTLEQFCYGYPVMERTWLEGYRRLAPATILTADSNSVRSQPYWVYKYDESAPVLKQETYWSRFGLLLDRATERCMKGSHQLGIFLSGGYDSRSVAASIRSQHLPLPAFSFGDPQSRDVRFAAMLAKRLALDHFPLTDKGPYLYRNCRAIVWRTEGFIPFANTTSIRYHPLLKRKIDIILLGFLGEFSGSHTWPQLLLARSRSAAIRTIFDKQLGGRLNTVRPIFQPSFFKQTFEAVLARFQQSFENVPNDHPLNIADSWNFMYAQPRSSFHSASIDRYLFEARAPHMDSELVSFLLTIPPYQRVEQRVYKKMIAYTFPQIRDVPCTNSGKPINPHFTMEYAEMAARYVGRKALAPAAKLFRRQEPPGREFRDLNADFRAEPELMDRVLRPLLASGILPARIFDHAGIEAVIREHYEQNASHENLLSLLISWGLAAKYFLHDDISDVPQEMHAL